MSRVYTRNGDEGTSSLYTGERRSKSDPIFGILGKADELNVWIGDALFLCNHCEADISNDQLRQIQSTIFALSANVATPRNSGNRRKKETTEFDPSATLQMETWIDVVQAQLPELRNFVFPGGGGTLSSVFHHARSTCRQLERKLSKQAISESLDPLILPYINRLSDYLFVRARASSLGPEITWSSAGTALAPRTAPTP